MFQPTLLLPYIDAAVGNVVLLSLAIILCTFVLEDTTVVIVGLLAADGIISIPLALFSLYMGVVIADIGFYSLGYYASTHPRLIKYMDHSRIATFRSWLETRYVLTIFSARFIPGSRFPTFAASGFMHAPFTTFILTVVVATSLWTTILFMLSYWFGNATSEWLQHERWLIAAAFVVILLLVGRRNVKKARPKDTLNILDNETT